METRNMVLLDIDYVTCDSKPVIRLFGKEKGSNGNNTIIALDKTFEPYIYVIPHDIGLCQYELENLGLDKIERIQKKDMGQEKEVLKVTLNHPQDVPKLRDDIWNLSQVKEIREHDIPFYRRYLIDKGIFPMSQIKIKGKIIKSSPCVFSASENTLLLEIEKPPQKLESDFPELKILSFDIEVRNPDGMPNAEKDEIIMVGISGNMGVHKVISTKGQHLDFVEKVKTEKKILEKFAEIVKNYQPDVIVGYNSDNFDFPYIKDRAKLLGVKLDLGVDGSELKFLRRGFAN
ncbi:MAG: DNA polymerase, partial [Euryarchaeota archaeon]|nr:DNA polymerase [Euryarchaeota archaeon]